MFVLRSVGVDPIAIIRALIANRKAAGNIQGASTITQQLYNIRQDSKGFRRHRTLQTKLRQAAWALREETRRSKSQILREYINAAYWGRSYYGIDQAALGYFSTTRNQLSVAQSFFLVERLASPNKILTDRLELLLKKLPLTLFPQDTVAYSDLIHIYDEHFSCGDLIRKSCTVHIY